MNRKQKIHSIDFTAVAALALEHKNAAAIFILAIDKSREGQVHLVGKDISESTGIAKAHVSTALSYLRDNRYMKRAQHSNNMYHINSCIVRTHNQRSLKDADFFPEFAYSKIKRLTSTPTASREAKREVTRMNKLSYRDIADTLPPSSKQANVNTAQTREY